MTVDNRSVTGRNFSGQEQHFWSQVFSGNALTGRCYWEVEWDGLVSVGITCRGIRRKGEVVTRRPGGSGKSWFLACTDHTYYICHDNKGAELHISPISHTVGVYLDCPAGVLSFYQVLSDKLIHLHTFHCSLTEPVYPALRFRFTLEHTKCSASLC